MSGTGYTDNALDRQVQIGLSVFAVRGVATLLGAAAGGVALDHWRGLPQTFESRSDTTLYILLVILYTKYTGRRQNDFSVYA